MIIPPCLAILVRMKSVVRIFAAVISAGIVSLFLELSLLREFVFVIGSSAFSNSLIISVFLTGLAAGTYFGTWKRIKSQRPDVSRYKFALFQISLILFVLLFYVTKDYFIYIAQEQRLVIAYFILATFIPSFISGATYTTVVELLYKKGERYVIYIYAISTLGNVIGGLIHGYVFVYLTGLQPAYTWAVIFSSLAVFLIGGLKRKTTVIFFAFAACAATVIQLNLFNDRLYRFDDLLFRQNSPFGLVEVWRMEDDRTSVEMRIGNIHQYYSYDWDNDLHAQWAATALEATARPSSVLLLGYGSGISSAAFLSSPLATRVDTVENSAPVLTAGKRFFPEAYRTVTTDPRSRILIEDFRKHIRFTDQKYDIVLLDHSILDPYYTGFFTTDFYRQLKRVLKPGGVIASLGIGLSWNTTRAVFPYVYTFTGADRQLVSENGFFLTATPLADAQSSRFSPASAPKDGGPLYTDHRVLGNSVATALRAIQPGVPLGRVK